MLSAFPKVRGLLTRLRLARTIMTVMHEKARAGELPFWRQSLEMLWLKLSRRQTFRFYLMARMWRREMPWQDKRAHFNHADFSRLVDTLNPPVQRQAFRHKRQQKQMLQQAGIATPDWLGFYHPQQGQLPSGDSLTTPAQLLALLNQHIDERLVFKRVVGSGGEGFLSYFVRSRGTDRDVLLEHPLTQQTLTLAQLQQQLGSSEQGYLIERHLQQHPLLARLNPDSANTLRIWATREANQLRVVGVFLRIGRRQVMVDNTAAGGLICTVDEQTGQLQQLSTGDLFRRELAQHPDSGVAVSHLLLPHFAAAKQLACDALACFPGMAIAGLDIAITEHGPEVIEINLDNPAQIGTACFDKPGRRLFPQFFANS